ncbi:UvrD-helicase domain-containing protein [Tepidibacter formicigenes]|uniref:UvrD/REP helicase N-terminal domain-containing protein n=1 Tax=Tepidibacter formicigenes DSM 15518 TaxID=1123349 RepID=A0A1M6RF25_9FIRM|nr:UvrD-helicase domain-containing protein [Tepidibacter formicigenes]SHK31052.1 UvrD/REP helicase N-terminal domain-containing protein [Tepidibacter formicigenes DSM 15518]
MRIYSTNVISELDSLRIKDSERAFYRHFKKKLKGIGITKVVPVEGINIDLMYIENNNILFIKFMDTNEDIYSILEEELLEVMEEEYINLVSEIKLFNLDVKYNMVYVMPYVDIDDNEDFGDFIQNHIIDKNSYKKILQDSSMINKYLKGENEDVILNLFRFYVCPEYHVIKKEESDRLINKDFKRISFFKDDYKYTALFLSSFQLKKLNSIKYGNTLFLAPAGSGKTTLLISRAIKLARLYPKDRFLFITFNKQLMNDIKNQIHILGKNPKNLEIYNFHGFVFKLAKQFNLVVDYNKLKENFSKYFENVFLQVKNVLKDKKIYKGIFLDECENFNQEEIEFIQGMLYKSKNIFNISADKGKDIKSNLKSFIGSWENIDFNDIVEFNYNYRQTKKITSFINSFTQNILEYMDKLNIDFPKNYYLKTQSLRKEGEQVEIITVEDIEEKIKAIIWEIEYLVNQKGFKYSDIAIIYPYNKRKLKNGNMIYFQYILRKALEESNIPYIYSNDELTNLSNKMGVTISNIYAINNLEYKAVIFCQIEMLYSHGLNEKNTNYEIRSFIKNLNIIYTALTRSIDHLTIITTFSEKNSDVIKMLKDSL